MSELHGDGLVTVQAGQLHVCGVVHEEGAEEVGGSDAYGGEGLLSHIAENADTTLPRCSDLKRLCVCVCV